MHGLPMKLSAPALVGQCPLQLLSCGTGTCQRQQQPARRVTSTGTRASSHLQLSQRLEDVSERTVYRALQWPELVVHGQPA